MFTTFVLLALAHAAFGQQQPPSAAIEQSRLFRQSEITTAPGVDANGNRLPGDGAAAASSDDSFGAQVILKTQERPRPFQVSGGASLFYTSNVALTRDGARSDGFAVVDAGFAWSPKLDNNLEATVGVHSALFRYFNTSELDFENLGVSAGLAWTPPALRGFTLFGRYDFTELLNSDGNQILSDHTFTLGVQKAIAFGRSHGLAFGVLGSAGISDPFASQRDQVGGFLDYHLLLTRHLETDLLVRPAVYFYNAGGRTDFNQVISLESPLPLHAQRGGQRLSLLRPQSFGHLGVRLSTPSPPVAGWA